MIRAFKKIRLKLFKENRIQKYLLYAIGEILLIVIGILIALQISNFNDKQKSKKLGDEMVSEIKAGIESDLSELDNYLLDQISVLKSQKIISNWLTKKLPYQDSLSKHFSRTYVTKDYRINYAGYENLKNTGLRRIENEDLRKSIANLYEIKYPTFIKYSEIYQKFLEELLSNNSKHFNELNYMRTTLRPINVETIQTDNEYSYHLNTLKNFNELLIYHGSVLKEEISKTYSKFK